MPARLGQIWAEGLQGEFVRENQLGMEKVKTLPSAHRSAPEDPTHPSKQGLQPPAFPRPAEGSTEDEASPLLSFPVSLSLTMLSAGLPARLGRSAC